MTTQHDYDPEIYTVLAGLGWSNNPNDYPVRYSELKNQNDSAFIFRPIKTKYDTGAFKKRFKLGVSYRDARGADEIPFREFDTAAPNWKRSVFTWHAMATFKLAEVRAKHAERDDRIRREKERQAASWTELCAGSTAMSKLAGPYSYSENNDVIDIAVNWSHRIYQNNPLSGLTITEKADKVRRLCEFLASEGWSK